MNKITFVKVKLCGYDAGISNWYTAPDMVKQNDHVLVLVNNQQKEGIVVELKSSATSFPVPLCETTEIIKIL
ncbi:MAG: hypothetical protein WC196_03315 [Bacilli bacterium]|jgi:hypothetical protein|nr:hypothetical protein [Bacilli bacterium]MDD3422471.1 hypothetical protein [Bacilli bacterium]MDD4066068.1 hypothetical protein [Bacilli bacterium]